MEGALRESQTLGNREYVPGISSFSTSATLGVEWRSCMFIIPAEQKGRTQSFTLPVSLAAAGSPLFLKETVEIPSCVALFYYTDGSKGLDPIFHLNYVAGCAGPPLFLKRLFQFSAYSTTPAQSGTGSNVPIGILGMSNKVLHPPSSPPLPSIFLRFFIDT